MSSRREFLQGSAVAALALAAGDVSQSTETPVTAEALTEFGHILVSGIPVEVNQNNVDFAKGKEVHGFESTVHGMEHVVAEPGGLLFEPWAWFADHNVDEYLANPDKHQRPFNELNHGLITAQPEAGLVVPANGLTLINCGGGRFEMPVEYSGTPAVIELPHVDGRHYTLIMKGRFADMTQDAGRNNAVKITKHQGGAVEWMHYNPGGQYNTPFVSEGQFRQITMNAHTVAANSGPAGAHEVVGIGFDINTGALSVVGTANERFVNQGAINYNLLATNWRK